MALKRIVGTAVRHPVATTAMVAGVAKGTLGLVRRLARGENPIASTDAPPVTVTETVREPEVVLLEPEDRDLPEPVVIEAVDDEPKPKRSTDPEGHIELEEELVWTSESPRASE